MSDSPQISDEPSTEPEGLLALKDWKFWGLAVLVGTVFFYLFGERQSLLWEANLGAALGASIGSMLPALLVLAVVKLFNRSRPDRDQRVLFLIIWPLTVALLMFGQVSSSRADAAPTAAASSFEYSPEGCDYVVTFPNEYRTYEVDRVTADGSGTVTILGAETSADAGDVGLKAECGALDYDVTALTREAMQPAFDQIAAELGLSMPTFEWEESPLGKVSTITGQKGDNSPPLMVQVINYHGPSSILTVYLISEAGDFLNDSMLDFKRTVRLR